MSGRKKRPALVIIGVLLFVVIVPPLVMAGLSRIGRVAPDSVIPDTFDIYVSVPDTARLAGNLLNHTSLPGIMALAELAPLTPLLNQTRNSGLMENRWLRLAAGGRLKAAVLPEDRILAVWDAGVISPLFRFLPALARRTDIPGLFYVAQAGGNSNFEFRLDDGTTFFIGPHRNLLVVTNDSALFQSVLDGTSRDGDIIGAAPRTFRSRNHDIAFLVSPDALVNVLASGDADPQVLSALEMLQFPGLVEVSLSVLPNQLNLHLVTPLGSGDDALQRLIERNSGVTPVLSMIPYNVQYMTMLAAGSLSELLDGAAAIAAGTPAGPEFEDNLRSADSAARMVFRMSLDEMLFSWSGSQFAVFGLEGRPHPVIAIEIRDEAQRRRVFDGAFGTIFLTEDIRLSLDGNRIPRVQVPGFINSVLASFGVNVPSPFYTVHNNYLLISESAESLLAAVNAVRRNEALPRNELWRALSRDISGPSSITLFYSLDHSMPFFLRGNDELRAILRLYRQGLVQLSLQNSVLRVSMSVISGAGRGIVPVAGYPMELLDPAAGFAQPRPGNRLFSTSPGANTRLLVTRGNDVLAISPLDRSVRELRGFGSPGASVYAIPQNPSSATAGEVWVVDAFGNVNLVNGNMESVSGFPITTGIRLSAAPQAWGGRLFLSGGGGLVYTVDTSASVRRWGNFSSTLLSPPSFLNFNNRTFVALYPRDIIFGQIFLLDGDGRALPNWPVHVPGIAFGSPLLFSARQPGTTQTRLFAAFVTQAGELAVYSETADILPGFPVDLEGVFFLQPVFDGESLWLIESEGTLFRVSLGGEVYSQHIPRLSVRANYGYIMAVGGEIFFSGEGNALHGFSRNFSSLDGFPLPVWGRPVIGDLFRDGQVKVAGVGMDNRLYMWQFR
ncbi:MAG: hypothetical protein FWC64_04560 [Treponema sp.]|nr:hypothetical protein [Treponema sp.]